MMMLVMDEHHGSQEVQADRGPWLTGGSSVIHARAWTNSWFLNMMVVNRHFPCGSNRRPLQARTGNWRELIRPWWSYDGNNKHLVRCSFLYHCSLGEYFSQREGEQTTVSHAPWKNISHTILILVLWEGMDSRISSFWGRDTVSLPLKQVSMFLKRQ